MLAVVAAWTLSVGFDLFLHAGVLAHLYIEPSPFLLPPQEAFRRIPLGYLAFLFLTIGLAWSLRRLGVRGSIPGFRYGAAAGAVVWGALAVGLYSISTATLPLLSGWWIGQTVELGLAGAVLGAAAAGVPMKRIWAIVATAVIALAAGTIALQSLGVAPAMKVHGDDSAPRGGEDESRAGAPSPAPSVQPIDSTIAPAVAGEDGWNYHQSSEVDLTGDGLLERVVLTARVELYRGRPAWDDGQPWQVYVESPDGERTYVYAQRLQLGTLTMRVSRGETPTVVLLEHLPDRLRVLEATYAGPGAVSVTVGFERDLDPRGETASPALP
jgi:hypothetical protein